jgi:hypothetical protein
LQALELLVVSVLIEPLLSLSGLRLLWLGRFALLILDLIELLLRPLAFLIAFEIFELFLALGGFGFLFLARFGLFL